MDVFGWLDIDHRLTPQKLDASSCWLPCFFGCCLHQGICFCCKLKTGLADTDFLDMFFFEDEFGGGCRFQDTTLVMVSKICIDMFFTSAWGNDPMCRACFFRWGDSESTTRMIKFMDRMDGQDGWKFQEQNNVRSGLEH